MFYKRKFCFYSFNASVRVVRVQNFIYEIDMPCYTNVLSNSSQAVFIHILIDTHI